MNPAWGFVGRTQELSRLARSGTSAAGSAEPHGLVIGGQAGIGKTRLLREGLTYLGTQRVKVLAAAATNATSNLPFGGLASVLPPRQPEGLSQAGLLKWAIDALLAEAGELRAVLAVDDIHLLDPLSAALVYFAARSGHVTVYATIRSGERVPDPVRALWTEALAERVELAPLSEVETGELLNQAFGGQFDGPSVAKLWRLSQGNPLLLRELVTAATTGGEIAQSYGVWRWSGEARLEPSLNEVIDMRIGKLSPQLRTVLEFTAHGEPLGLPLLVGATDPESVELAEELQLIRVVQEGKRVNVRLAHPLYGEVVRRRSPLIRAHRQLATLAELVEETGARRRDDLLRVGVWRMESNTATDPMPLLRALQIAFARYDVPLACRLGQAALAASDHQSFEIAEQTALLLMFTDQPAAGLEVLERAEALITTGAQRARWLGSRGITVYWGLGDATAAAALEAGAAELTDPRDHAAAQAVLAMMRVHANDPAGTMAVAQSVLGNPRASSGTHALAASALCHLSAVRGSPVSAMAKITELERGSAQWIEETPYFQLAFEVARGTAMILAADLAAVEATVATEFAGLVDAGDFGLGTGYLTVIRAQAARLTGQAGAASRHARQALAMLASGNVFGGLASAELAHALALSGDCAGAAQAMADADRLHPATMRILYPDLERARIWAAVAGGELESAVQSLQSLAGLLRADGFTAYEVYALHDLVRLGCPELAADRLTELAAQVEGPLAGATARHASAAVAGDGSALLASAREFAGLSLTLYAAEAAAMAVRLLRQQRSPLATSAAELLAGLRESCPEVKTPALTVPATPLTERERQIAKLAAAGRSSKQIAEQIYVSPRTVDNHLMHIYTKLGINSRAGLPAALRSYEAE
jgi:DNA-binding CsgD family transcriptional regulator